VHDAISAERLGIPAAGVITDRFASTARVMAEFVGLPGYPVAIVAHPISNNTDAEIRAKAEQIVQQAIALLQSPLRARDLL
jgi:sensor domain CHASE-containing protein